MGACEALRCVAGGLGPFPLLPSPASPDPPCDRPQGSTERPFPQSQPKCPHAVVLQMAILRRPVFTPWAFLAVLVSSISLSRLCLGVRSQALAEVGFLNRFSCHHLDRGRPLSWDRAQPEAWADTAPLRGLWVLDLSPFGASLTCPLAPRPHAFPTCNELGPIETQGGGWGCILRGQLRVLGHMDWGLSCSQNWDSCHVLLGRRTHFCLTLGAPQMCWHCSLP